MYTAGFVYLLALTVWPAQARIGCPSGQYWDGHVCRCDDGGLTKGFPGCASDRFDPPPAPQRVERVVERVYVPVQAPPPATPYDQMFEEEPVESSSSDSGSACAVVGFGAPLSAVGFAAMSVLRRRRASRTA